MTQAQDTQPLGSFSAQDQDSLVAAGIYDEMVLWDRETRTAELGAVGILRKLRKSWVGPLAALLSLPGVIKLTTLVYRFIASNRRYLSVPEPQPIRCACDPKPRPAYQVALVLLCGALGFAGSASWGSFWTTTTVWSPLGPSTAAAIGIGLHLALIAWLLYGNSKYERMQSEDRRSLFWHTLVAATAAAIPLLLLLLLPQQAWFEEARMDRLARSVVSLVSAAFVLFRAHRSLVRRRSYLGLRP